MGSFEDKLCNFKSFGNIEYPKMVGMKGLHGRYGKALKAFTDRVLKELGDRVESIVVYGSVARGEAGEDSDIDVLIVGRDKEMRSNVLEIGYDVDYENSFETFITPICFTSEEFEHRMKVGSPFIFEVLKEGVTLYDDGTFKRIREKVSRTSG